MRNRRAFVLTPQQFFFTIATQGREDARAQSHAERHCAFASSRLGVAIPSRSWLGRSSLALFQSKLGSLLHSVVSPDSVGRRARLARRPSSFGPWRAKCRGVPRSLRASSRRRTAV